MYDGGARHGAGDEELMVNSAQERFLTKLRAYKPVSRVSGIRSAVYSTHNEVWLAVLYSGGTRQGKYWFGVDSANLDGWRQKSRVVLCFICGDENTVVFLPDDQFLRWYEGVTPNKKGQWMVNILPSDDKLVLHVAADRRFDVTEYVNRYDFVSRSIPLPMSRPILGGRSDSTPYREACDAIMGNLTISGDSLHERIVDMLAQIAQWSGYSPSRGYKVQPDSPYELDIVWLDRDLLEIAIEVQVGGNETEAKDRLTLANRFGARKVIIVSAPESINRLKSLFRYESTIKNWLEIWGIPRVYDMYVSGAQFHEWYRPFIKPQWSEEIAVIE
ncbi:MAG: hypothetical protein IIC32_03940 [Chloroflexi bacterium]|nr:hypothetical protein [Chloroflexota bacterium]